MDFLIKESDFQRIIAIGDIHGYNSKLVELIDLIGPTHSDLLVFLGDYINRGPDSKGVITTLLGLRSKTNTKFILGNHDEMALMVIAGGGKDDEKFFNKFGEKSLESYNVKSIKNIPRDHCLFFSDTVDFVESENHIFVHAGVDPDKELILCDQNTLRWKHIDKSVKPHCSGKVVICGHTSFDTVLDVGHTICIDTGCGSGKQLTGYDVLAKKVYQV
jgi:serine/threonine protein phosphatase 1